MGIGLLKDRKILLVGASGDIGQILLDRFVAEGAHVMATVCAHPEKLQKYAGSPSVKTFTMDVTNPAAMESVFEAIQPEGIDSIIYNAGIIRDGLLLGMEEKDWLDVLEVNLNGAFRVARIFGRILFRRRAGRMIFISSVAGTRGGRGQSNYAASKAGLEAMVRSLAAEMAPRGVLVNAIAPGPIESRMTKDVMDLAKQEVLGRVALGRLGRPEEIAAAAAYLLAPDMTFITGQTIHVDGGFGL